jgi:hypothetical protein
VQEWESVAPSDPARALLRAIKGDPEGLRRTLAEAGQTITSPKRIQWRFLSLSDQPRYSLEKRQLPIISQPYWQAVGIS